MEKSSLLRKYFDKTQYFLEAMASNVRQDIIVELAEIYPKGKRIKEFQIKKCLTRPTMSHHLKLLYKAGIVSYRTEGTKNYYFLSIEPNDLEASLQHLYQFIGKSNDTSD